MKKAEVLLAMSPSKKILRQINDPTLGPNERAQLRCQLARELEEAGNYETAQAAMGELWQRIGERPALDGLDEKTSAEVLLRAGALSGWIGSANQVAGAQEIAEDLISESLQIFEKLHETEKSAEAYIDIGICYWREGAFDEARVIFREVVRKYPGISSEQKARALLNSARVEMFASRYHDALQILTKAASLFEASSNHATKGGFHNVMATVLTRLGRAESREEYIDRALVEYAAASYHFEQAGNIRYRAGVENNLGYLLLINYKLPEAHEHLDRARHLFITLQDKRGVAQVDETRAQAFIAEKRYVEAEKVASAAIDIFEKGEEETILAEALLTYGISIARLGKYSLAQTALQKSRDLSLQAGDLEGSGKAALTLIEELIEQIPQQELRFLFERAADLLARSQNPEILARLVSCARRIFDFQSPTSKYRALNVFLCHASDDKPAVRELYNRLHAENINPWLDEENLHPGQEWEVEIPKAVRGSDVVIVCLSKNSISKTGFVQKEIKDALDVADLQPEGTIFLIPLKLEECEVPDRLCKWQWLNFYEVSGFTRLMNSLRQRAINLNLAIP